MENKIIKGITNCMDCDKHITCQIYTPDSWDHEEGCYCSLVKSEEPKFDGYYKHQTDCKKVCQHDWDLRKSAQIPDWCPLLGKNKNENKCENNISYVIIDTNDNSLLDFSNSYLAEEYCNLFEYNSLRIKTSIQNEYTLHDDSYKKWYVLKFLYFFELKNTFDVNENSNDFKFITYDYEPYLNEFTYVYNDGYRVSFCTEDSKLLKIGISLLIKEPFSEMNTKKVLEYKEYVTNNIMKKISDDIYTMKTDDIEEIRVILTNDFSKNLE